MNCIKVKINNKECLLDLEDAQVLVDHDWHLHINKTNGAFYLRGWDKDNKKKILMHRLIMQAKVSEQVDHINGNSLDNRKDNLRICNHSENVRNRKKPKSNTSGYKGVSWCRASSKWKALIGINNKRIYLGIFNCKHKAALAYNEAAIKYHGEYAMLNAVEEVMSDVE